MSEDNIIDIQSILQEKKSEQAEEKIENYAVKLSVMLNLMDEILDDIEESNINWSKVDEHQKEVIECISTLGMMMEVYAGWSRHF